VSAPERYRFKDFLVGSLLVLCSLSACDRSHEVGLNPGDTAPELVVQKLDGTPTKLSDYRGKTVLLNFWASWCGPCESEIPAFEELYARLKDKDFTVVAVALDDSLENIKEFSVKHSMSFPVLYDAKASANKLYKISGFPESFLLDKNGKLIMMPDPEDNDQLVVRFVGPRAWQAPTMLKRLLTLVTDQKGLS